MYFAAVDPGITPNASFPFLESLKQPRCCWLASLANRHALPPAAA
jgi:hypothetical protein